MIDPTNITNFNRTQDELEEFLIFAILAAGKNAKVAARQLENMIKRRGKYSPLSFLGGMPLDLLQMTLLGNGVGCYKMKAKAIWCAARQLSCVDLRQGKPETFEAIPGIGLKTSRFFILHSRAGANLAVLDTHILKGMASLGYQVPKATPSNTKVYRAIEQLFIQQAYIENKTPAELDLEWWLHYSGNKAKT